MVATNPSTDTGAMPPVASADGVEEDRDDQDGVSGVEAEGIPVGTEPRRATHRSRPQRAACTERADEFP